MTSARAWAHCGNRQIAYARAGHGRTLVLLTTATLDDLTGAPATELARSFRLIRPELAELAHEPAVCASCVTAFLDALGVGRVIVVADPRHARAVEPLADAEPDRIERVIVLPTPLSAPQLALLLESLTAATERPRR